LPCGSEGDEPLRFERVNSEFLVRVVVREMAALLADIATLDGQRMPVGDLPGRLFTELSRELEGRGVGRKVAADMFHMDLRAYLRKIHRLEESATSRGRSLWEAVYRFLQDGAVRTREQVLERFVKDVPELVRGVLHDLVESGLVFVSGTGPKAAYRVAGQQELDALRAERARSDEELLWVVIFRSGPVTALELTERLSLPPEDVEAALGRLVEEGRVRRSEASSMEYSAVSLVIPKDDPSGPEAAILDHLHAVLATIRAKLTAVDGKTSASGSTYVFHVWDGHPLESEVAACLERFRAGASELRRRVLVENAARTPPEVSRAVTVYAGQSHREVHRDGV